MKIYFAGSIKGGRGDVTLYKQIISYLKNFGTVLTEHIGNDDLTSDGEKDKSGTYIHDRDIDWVRESDVLIAEVSTPSLGVGYELGRVYSMQKHVLCLCKKTKKHSLSSMITGAKKFEVQYYKNFTELQNCIKSFFASL